MFSISSENKFETINVNDLGNLLSKINLIDIREEYEYKNGHVPSAKNIPMGVILNTPEKYLDKSKEYHIICQSGGRSSKACSELVSKGYNIINVGGGTGSYVGSLER